LAHQFKRDVEKLKKVQQRTTKTVMGPECMNYKERLSELGLFSLLTGRLSSDLIGACKCLKGGYTAMETKSLVVADRGNNCKW